MPNLLEVLTQRVLVGDGAMGTQLLAAGLEPGGCSEEWNVSHAEAVQRIQCAYVEAGSDLLITNTFGGNRIALSRHGLEARLDELNAAGVKDARAAGGPDVFVLGDIGPTGAMPESLGGCGEDEFFDVFLQQAKALAAAGVDAFIIETMTAVEEIRAAVRAAREAAALPVIASAAYDPTPEGSTFRTMMGASVEEMAQAALDCDADVVGANCGSVNMRDMVPIAGTIRALTAKPVIIQANAGRPELVEGRAVYPEPPGEFAEHVGELVKLGVRIIGGCCGTTPAHIQAVARAVKGA
jgi:5-methyltetrahydrofolate--homocysteine methyltransferase